MKAKISDIYKYCVASNKNLFGNVSGFSFMAGYSANVNDFDFLFNKRYSTFFYFPDYEKGSSIENIYNDFAQNVKSLLRFNEKRYTELFRVHVLSENAYDIVNNYDLTETSTRQNSDSGNNIYGAKTDTRTENVADTFGDRLDETEVENGTQRSTTENTISAFNSQTYQPDNNQETTIQQYTNSGSTRKGEQQDTHATTENTTYGSHTDTETHTGTETINLRRYGNIGVQTAAEIIGGHIELWDSFNFYAIIFSDLAKEMLLLDDNAGASASGGVFSDSDVTEILKSINALKTKVDNMENTILDELTDVRVDITDVHDNVHEAESNILQTVAGVSIKLDTVSLQASTLAGNIINNDNTNTANIRGDIAEVESNGY